MLMFVVFVCDVGGVLCNFLYIEGYRFVEDFFDDWIDFVIGMVFDVCGMIEVLGIEIVEIVLEIDIICGVGLVGDGMGLMIVVNMLSIFNIGEEGRCFMFVYELCYIFYDCGYV